MSIFLTVVSAFCPWQLAHAQTLSLSDRIGLCVSFLMGRPIDVARTTEIKKLQILINDDLQWGTLESIQTVFFSHKNEDGTITLLHPHYNTWGSVYPFRNDTTLKQGSVVSLLRILGAELAYELGFRSLPDPRIDRLIVPGAQMLSEKIKNLNKILIAQGKEPILYQVVPSSFLSTEDLFNLASSKTEGFLLRFPYADGEDLTPHEVNFHLAAIMLPRSVLERAAAINDQVIDFIKFMEGRDSVRNSEEWDWIKKRFYKQRATELDYGTGNFAHFLNVYLKLAAYELNAREVTHDNMIIEMAQLTHAEYTPLQMVYLYLKLFALRLDLTAENALFSNIVAANFNRIKGHVGRLVLPINNKALREATEEYFQSRLAGEGPDHSAHREVKNQDYVDAILNGLNKRRVELIEAAKILNKKNNNQNQKVNLND